MTTNLQIGKKAPDFSLENDEHKLISLKDFLGNTVVLYFYPKDNTPGCTKESCDFRDSFTQLTAHGITVLGISKDTVKSHQKFKEKYHLPFMLLSDPDKKVAQQYGVFIEKNLYGIKYMGTERSTFLIDAKGMICQIWRKVKVKGHVSEIIKFIEK